MGEQALWERRPRRDCSQTVFGVSAAAIYGVLRDKLSQIYPNPLQSR
jgi:hypothetical protein